MSFISNSKPRPFADVGAAQSSSSSHSALPPSAPHRTLSGPSVLQTSSITDVLQKGTVTPSSTSLTSNPQKSLRFAKEDDVLKKSKTTPVPLKGSIRGEANRRHSDDPRINVHTKCGRNSDDWLFGGWHVADAVKKIWEKDPEPNSPVDKKR